MTTLECLNPVLSITLPTPTYGTAYNNVGDVYLRRNMAGNARTVIHKNDYKIIEMTFDNIKFSVKESLDSFLRQTRGLDIRFTDQYSNIWDGKIINTAIEITKNYESNNHNDSTECTDGESKLKRYTATIHIKGLLNE
jgi:hypothetical protein